MAYCIVRSASQQLGTLLVAEAKYLYGVHDKVENLQGQLIHMNCFLQDADDREHQEAQVRHWVAEIREIAYEAEDIIEKFVHEVSHHRKGGFFSTVKWLCCLICDARTLHEVGSNIEGLRSRITLLTSRLQSYGIRINSQSENSTHSAMLRERRRTYAHIEENVVGMEEEVKELVHMLVNTKSQVLGICGMGGLGKTTLARKVYSNSATKQQFSSCAWVHVSQNVERRRVFEEILSQLGDKDARRKIKELTDQEIPAEICKVLGSKKCLIVLDDIWNIDAWKLLEPAFVSMKSSPSKILLTTRNDEVLKDPEYNAHLYRLRFLNDEEAWTLLRQKAFLNKDDTVEPEMEALGKEMLKHCKGLPLAIVALGGVLATKKSIKEWEDVQMRITSYLTREVGEGSVTISSVLELSFYELPFYLKPCFLYLGSFPEDYEISVERLYLLWEAEGFTSAAIYEAQNQGVSHVEIAERYLNELVKRNMVQAEKRWPNGRIESCRLHDVMRDVSLKKCEEVNFLSVLEAGDLHNPSSGIASSLAKSKRIHRCAIHQWHSYQNPERIRSVENTIFHYLQSNARFLRSLLAFSFVATVADGTKVFSSEVKKFSLLRVLDLEGCIKYNILKVIGGLIHLRYLSLKGSHFRKLPSCIFDLEYLETLVLESGDGVVMLLPNKFWKMKRLKHLYLPRKFEIRGFEKLTIGSGDHQRSQMETLKNFDPEKCKMEGLLTMTNLRIFSLNEDYIFEGNEVWKVFLQSPLMKSHQLMNCLKLRVDATILNEDPATLTSPKVEADISSLEIRGTIHMEFRHFPPGLLRLKLDGCKISAEGISELEKLPHLKELVLVNNAVRDSKITTSAEGFPQLIALQVEHLDDLEEWELLGKEALPKLRDLKVKGCPRWDGWPQGGDLPKLRNVFIE